MVSFELREYVDAIERLRAALEETRDKLSTRQREEVEDLLARAHNFVGTYGIATVPDSASVELDGEPLQSSNVMLEIGEHELLLDALGDAGLALRLVAEHLVVALRVLPRARARRRLEAQRLVLLRDLLEVRVELHRGELQQLDRLQHPRREQHLLRLPLTQGLVQVEAGHPLGVCTLGAR